VLNHKIGFIALARPTFDIGLAAQVTRTAWEHLSNAGWSLLGTTDLIMDLSTAQQAVTLLSREELDLVIIFQASFADSSMLLHIAAALPAPILLWATPEAHTGDRLRLNSLCGINLGGHALKLRGRHYDYLYKLPGDRSVIDTIIPLAAAGRVIRKLRTASLGVVGEHPGGMDSCYLDSALLHEKLGIKIVKIDLEEVFQRARTVQPARIQTARNELDSKLSNLAELDQVSLKGTLGVYASLKEIAKELKLDGLAVRCWPEFFTDLGCSACGAMSMLTNELIPCSCEADANGTITQMILQWLSSDVSFGSDMVSIDPLADAMILWHCGLAPLSMAEASVQPRGTIHSNRKLPLVMEFPLKQGQVTLARLSRASGELRLVIASGEMIAYPPAFSGTTGALRFTRPVESVLDTILTEGLEHHISLTYGDYMPAIRQVARLLSLPVLEL
jgi:L-fucose isomerase-like protein